MKRFAIGLAAVLMLLSLRAAAEPLPYTEGSVWNVTFIRVKPGMGDDYLRQLAATWKKVFEEAKKQKLVLSYKVLSSESANPHDFELMLMVEYRNMAALDGLEEKMKPILEKAMGSEDAQRQTMVKRMDVREIFGEKLFRELMLK
jgi:hypothetical protein